MAHMTHIPNSGDLKGFHIKASLLFNMEDLYCEKIDHSIKIFWRFN